MKREFVIGVENAEGESGPWFIERCRVPPYPQKLTIHLDPFGILCTYTELHVDVASSVDVDYKNSLSLCARGWTTGVLVTNVECVTQVAQGCPLEKACTPDLGEHEKPDRFERIQPYLQAV